MTSNKNVKLAARAYAEERGISYTQALRAVSERTGLPPLPTGMSRLDQMLGGGLPRGGLTALWSATGVGTSMFGITLARITAMSAHRAVIVGAEDQPNTYVSRMVAATTGIATNDLHSGTDLAAAGWPPPWLAFLDLYEPAEFPADMRQVANELEADIAHTGRAPALVVIDDLGALAGSVDDNVQVLTTLAWSLRAAIVVLEALPPALCRVEPANPTEMQAQGIDLMLTWPERAPTDDELRAHPRTAALANAASASMTLTTPGDPPVLDLVAVLDLTVRSAHGDGGEMKVRRDGPRSRILPGG
jgi:hypothetical protein